MTIWAVTICEEGRQAAAQAGEEDGSADESIEALTTQMKAQAQAHMQLLTHSRIHARTNTRDAFMHDTCTQVCLGHDWHTLVQAAAAADDFALAVKLKKRLRELEEAAGWFIAGYNSSTTYNHRVMID